jgi:hypothetical protein
VAPVNPCRSASRWNRVQDQMRLIAASLTANRFDYLRSTPQAPFGFGRLVAHKSCGGELHRAFRRPQSLSYLSVRESPTSAMISRCLAVGLLRSRLPAGIARLLPQRNDMPLIWEFPSTSTLLAMPLFLRVAIILMAVARRRHFQSYGGTACHRPWPKRLRFRRSTRRPDDAPASISAWPSIV